MGEQRTPREPKNYNPGALGCRILSKLNGIFLNKLISEEIVRLLKLQWLL